VPRRRPAGRLRVDVSVAWLQNCAPEDDALTEMSRLSLGPSAPSSAGGDEPGSVRAAEVLRGVDQARGDPEAASVCLGQVGD
jgi:hypothetical protein